MALSMADHSPGQIAVKKALTAVGGPPRSAACRTAGPTSGSMEANASGARAPMGGSENTAPASRSGYRRATSTATRAPRLEPIRTQDPNLRASR